MKDKILERLLSAYGHLFAAQRMADIYFRPTAERLYYVMGGLNEVINEHARCIVSVDSLNPQGDDCGTPKPQGD